MIISHRLYQCLLMQYLSFLFRVKSCKTFSVPNSNTCIGILSTHPLWPHHPPFECPALFPPPRHSPGVWTSLQNGVMAPWATCQTVSNHYLVWLFARHQLTAGGGLCFLKERSFQMITNFQLHIWCLKFIRPAAMNKLSCCLFPRATLV